MQLSYHMKEINFVCNSRSNGFVGSFKTADNWIDFVRLVIFAAVIKQRKLKILIYIYT